VTRAFTLEKNPAKQPLLQHEVAKTANKCSFRNALHMRLVSRAVQSAAALNAQADGVPCAAK